MEKFGVICGYDIKHDLNAARFKTSILTYCDSTSKGRIGMAAISNCEISEVHKMHITKAIVMTPLLHMKSIYTFLIKTVVFAILDHAHYKLVLHSNQ